MSYSIDPNQLIGIGSMGTSLFIAYRLRSCDTVCGHVIKQCLLKNMETKGFSGQIPEVEKFKRLYRLAFMGFVKTPKPYKKFFIFQGIFFFLLVFIWVKFNGGLLPTFDIRRLKLTGTADLVDHFDVPDRDGIRITWLRAVNSQSALQTALQSDAMVVEGDIVLRGQGTSDQQLVPVMAEPPRVTSDLTLAEWLAALKSSGKGLKLNFKSIEVVDISLQLLRDVKKDIQAPVFLNADIFEGPNGKPTGIQPIDAHRFLRLCDTHFPQATISLGWTWVGSENVADNRYDWTMVKTMHDLVEERKSKQPVAINIRSSLVRSSLPQFKWLAEMTGASLVIFSVEEEETSVKDLQVVRAQLPKHKVYYNLHDSLNIQFRPVSDDDPRGFPMEMHQQKNTNFGPDDWKVVRSKDGEVIYLGSESLVLQRGFVITKTDYKDSPLKVTGRVEFFDVANDDVKIDIFLRVAQSGRPDTISGVGFSIGSAGAIGISTRSIPGTDTHVKSSIPGTLPCYVFTITDTPNDKIAFQVWRLKNCANAESEDESDILEVPAKDLETHSSHVAIKGLNSNGFAAIDLFTISS